MDELVKYLKALVYLQVQTVDQEKLPMKIEALLSSAGLSYREIADMLGKSEPAVAKAVTRARSAKKGKNDD